MGLKMVATEGSVVEGLTVSIIEDLKRNGIDTPWLKPLIRAHVSKALQVVQHRLYQDVAVNLLDIARQLYPPGERKGEAL